MNTTRLISAILIFMLPASATAQADSLLRPAMELSGKYIEQVSEKIDAVDKKLSRQTCRTLAGFEKQEARLLRKLGRKDTAQAGDMLALAAKKLGDLQNDFTNVTDKAATKLTGTYNAYIDTVKNSFKFLAEQEQRIAGKPKIIAAKLKSTAAKLNMLDEKFQQVDAIKKYLQERKAYLRGELEKYGMIKQLRKIEQLTYYYNEYIKEYKDILANRKKLERKAMDLLYATPVFKKFISENSLLAGFFRLPEGNSGTNATPTIPGIQTRAAVTDMMQTAIAAGGPDAMARVKQQIEAGQAELGILKDRIAKYGASDAELPSFKPNSQKTKRFLKRFEYGLNIQFGKASQFMPTTADIALSVGYKLNDKSTIGVSAAYKLGMGSGWNNIQFSSQGLGLRSYVDWKLKAGFFISGGYEQNYNSQFKNIRQLKSYSSWQSSGLVGVSKKLQVKGKKIAKIQLLYDFLCNRHVPVTQPFIFRTGYNFK